jgi:hypothetical protein
MACGEFSASYDTTTKVVSGAICALLAGIVLATHNLPVAGIGVACRAWRRSTNVPCFGNYASLAIHPVVAGFIVGFQQVAAKIAAQVAPDGVNVIGAVLRIVHFDQEG